MSDILRLIIESLLLFLSYSHYKFIINKAVAKGRFSGFEPHPTFIFKI